MTDSMLPEGETSPAEALMRLLAGKWVVQAIASAAELGVAEALAVPAPLEVLAERLACNPEALERVLDVLVGEGILERDRRGWFTRTALGGALCEPGMKQLARFVGSRSQWLPWAELPNAVRTGRSAFEQVHGQPLFDYLSAHPHEARLYDEAVDAFTAEQSRALAKLPWVRQVEHVVDVGGGRGTLLLELLWAHAGLRATLVERPSVIAAARERLARAGVAERCEFFSGDFFEALPGGADCYVVKHVLHNWDDERAVQLLRGCAAVAAPGARICVVEGILLAGNRRDPARLMNLEMFVLTGRGRERSKPQFRALFRAAGLVLQQTQRLASGAWLMVGRDRDSAVQRPDSAG